MTPIHCAIAIPVYNNASTIYDIAKKSRALLDHVIVVDDGSTDSDLTQLLKPLDVTVLKHPTNKGKGQSLLTAFHHAYKTGAQYLITLDGDGQHFPEDIPNFLPYLSPNTILIGYRKYITGQMPKSSQFGRDFSDFWITSEAGSHPQDTQSGFRAYPLQPILQLQTNSRHYNFEMEIITRALWAGLKTATVPIHVYYPPKEKSQSSFHPLKDNLRISQLHTKLILRQLLPWPHHKILKAKFSLHDFLFSNSSPLGLAVCAWISIVMSVVLWPWGIFPIAYITTRLHLNKIIALICVVVCASKLLPQACMAAGKSILPSKNSTLQWMFGSHLLAIPIATGISCILCTLAIHFYRRGAKAQRASSNSAPLSESKSTI